VPRVGEDGAVLHALEVAPGEDVLVAGSRAEDVADLGGLVTREHLEAVHERFERPQRIHLGDDHVRAHAAGTHGDAAADPAVPADDEAAAGEKHVRGADDPVDRGLAGAVAVVEEMLRLASFTATIGKPSLPSASRARRRITPVVVSSVPPTISPS
jgi:hypothetical protein